METRDDHEDAEGSMMLLQHVLEFLIDFVCIAKGTQLLYRFCIIDKSGVNAV